MRNIKTLLGIIISIVLHSCGNNYSESELKAHFNKEQISDLNEIRTFFINQICDSDFKTCYEQTDHDSLLFNEGTGIWKNINFEEQKKLYERISKSTFNEIWDFCDITYYPSKTKTKFICVAYEGEYLNYLSDIGKVNPKVEKYVDELKATGDFHPLTFSYQNILKDKISFDLNDPNIQLIIAIHYLSINDQTRRNTPVTQLTQDMIFE